MRGLGDFQRAQMRDADLRISDLLGHLRHAIDVLEQIMLRPYRPAAELKRVTEVEPKSPARQSRRQTLSCPIRLRRSASS